MAWPSYGDLRLLGTTPQVSARQWIWEESRPPEARPEDSSIYPDACGDPATVPRQGVVGIESDSDEYVISASFPVFFYRFSHDFGMILAPF